MLVGSWSKEFNFADLNTLVYGYTDLDSLGHGLSQKAYFKAKIDVGWCSKEPRPAELKLLGSG